MAAVFGLPEVMQNTAALFLRLGYYDARIRRLHRRYKARWKEMAIVSADVVGYSFCSEGLSSQVPSAEMHASPKAFMGLPSTVISVFTLRQFLRSPPSA